MLVDGLTMMHEHVYIDLSGVKNTDDCKLDCKEETIKEFKELYKNGVRNIIEVTNIGMGRDIKYVQDVAKESNINILCSTGFYKEPFLPEIVYNKTEKELAKIMIDEITIGIDNTDVKAAMIGEVGSSKDIITELEKKVLTAAAYAHSETGTPITTHTSLGTMGIEQILLFKSLGVNLNKVILGHVDLTGDIEYILRLIDTGVYVEFDTIGKVNYLKDEIRVDMLKEIEKRNLIDRVLLSMDITRKSNMAYKGGIGYNYLFNVFIPSLLDAGITQQSIDKMLHNNPINFFK